MRAVFATPAWTDWTYLARPPDTTRWLDDAVAVNHRIQALLAGDTSPGSMTARSELSGPGQVL
jgi:hypothetical protein